MSCQRPLHLDVVAVVGVQKIGADQEQNQLGRFQVLVDGILPGAAGGNLAVVPGLNDPLPLQETQVRLQLVPKRFVLMGIGIKHADRRTHGGLAVHRGTSPIGNGRPPNCRMGNCS